jgi:hypothetical protein
MTFDMGYTFKYFGSNSKVMGEWDKMMTAG